MEIIVDIYIYKYRDDYICKEIIAKYLLSHDKYLVEFLARNEPLLASTFHAVVIKASLFFH